MSYQSIDQLTKDPDFIGRTNAAATEQAQVFINDARPDYVALAESVLKGAAGPLNAFARMNASGPGIGEKVDIGNDKIDQSQVTDADLLALTQGNWPIVGELFFAEDGTPA